MKYLIYILIFCLMFSGCTAPTVDQPADDDVNESVNSTDQPEDDNTIESMYYFYKQSSKLYKYNLITGSVSTVCTDPVCDHEFDCFFTDVQYVCANKNTIYFSKSDSDTILSENGMSYIVESICSFDYESGQSKELCSLKSGPNSSLQGMIEYYDGYIYFYRQTPDPEVIEFSLYRVPADGGEVEDMGVSVPMWHGAHYNDRIFFFDNVNTLYSTDIYGNNRVDEVVLDSPARIAFTRDTSDGHLYYTIMYSDSNEIWRKNISSGESELLYTTELGIVASLYRTNSGIYFLISGEEIQYGDASSGARIIRDPYAGKIYKLNPDTGECEVVYDDVNTHILYLRISKNKIIVFCDEFGENNEVITNRFILNN